MSITGLERMACVERIAELAARVVSPNPRFMPLPWPRLALCAIAVWVCVAGGCTEEEAPLREWRPEDHGQPQQADPARVPSEPDPGREQAGGEARAAATLWKISCASCHGAEGNGDGASQPPAATIPDFRARAWQRSRTDAQLAEAIRDGRGAMPAFGARLNERGVAALVRHIRRLSGAAGVGGSQAQPEAAAASRKRPAQPPPGSVKTADPAARPPGPEH